MRADDGIAAPRLSLCLIVKDEADLLPACLDSVAGVAQEIVACDTGSSDGTLEILRERANLLVQEPWCDDFAAARNAALAAATGDWILCLDADERLRPGGETALRRALADARALAYRVTIVNRLGTDVGDTTATARTGAIHILRLFRNRPDIRYTGSIHEQVAPAIARVVEKEPGWEVRLLEGVVVDHLGYDPAVKDQLHKLARNFALLEREIAVEPENPYHHYKAYQNDPARPGAEASLFRAAELALDAPQSRLRRLGYADELLTSASFRWQQRGDAAAAERAARAALDHFADHPAPHLALGLALAAQGRDDEALAEIDSFFAVKEAADAFYFDREPAELTARLIEARILRRQGRPDRALASLEETRRRHPGAAAVPVAVVETLLAMDRPGEALKLGVAELKALPSRPLALRCAEAADRIGDKRSAAKLRDLAGRE